MDAGPGLHFTALAPAPNVDFWQELTRLKLEVQRLDSAELPLLAHFEVPPACGAPARVFLLREAFEASRDIPVGGVSFRGALKNFNTLEEFTLFLKGGARAAKIAEVCQTLRDDIVDGTVFRDPSRLRHAYVVAFADLKKYHFSYTVAFPSLSPVEPWKASFVCGAEEGGLDRRTIREISRALREEKTLAEGGIFCLVPAETETSWKVVSPNFLLEPVTEQDYVVGFVDPAASDEAPGSPLRNLLLALAQHRPGRRRILAFRDPHLSAKPEDTPARSRLFTVEVPGEVADLILTPPHPPAEFHLAGWSKIHTSDLTAFMNKEKIAEDAVDLNLKLMKWRILPDLEPQRMKELRCLLLGAGTLGCNVARNLMAWGVRHMTFVDSGQVSFSNPARQTLFTHRDAAESRPKALAAAEAVRAVMPEAKVEAVQLEIPMPGHPHQSTEVLRSSATKLKELIHSHDVVFMMTDSRESRWLPSLMVSAAQRGLSSSSSPPLGLTVALGFDSFLVSRQAWGGSSSGCYFCNDVTAPSDSLSHRTLDQQCTVTRPGLSGMACSVAVELLAALVQHADGFGAASSSGPTQGSLLGATPHQIRGSFSDLRLIASETEPFQQCICCCSAVQDRYAVEGLALIERTTVDSKNLEAISGLEALKAGVSEVEVLNFDDFDDE